VTGNVTAGSFLGDGSLLTGITTIESNVDLIRNTDNTAFINLNSNVVAEFPRSKKVIKYPRVAMTANSSGGYVADQTNTASHGNADAYAYRLFDNTSGAYQSGSAYSSGNPTASAPTTTASDGSTHHGVAITLDLVTKIRLDHVVITSHTNYGRTPVDGTFLGSDNSSSWDVIQTFSGLSTSADNQKHTIYVTNPSQKLAYRYIRFVITKTHTSPVFNGGSLLEFRETEYYGVPEHDPEAHGTDVTVKSYPNVPNTDWLELHYDAENYSGAGDVQDETGNNSGGILDGVTYDSVSKSFTFDGGDKIYRGPMTAFTSGTSYTASIWFKIPEIVTSQYILFHFGHGTSGESFGLNIQRGNVGAFLWGGSTAYTTDNLYSADEWVNAACTINGSIVNVYLNGTLQLSYTQDIVITIPTNPCLSLGIHFNGEQSSFFTGGFFIGSMANFRLFNRALTSDEIYQLYAYQKEYFGHGDLSMTLKAGRLGIGTSEPRAALDVRGRIMREYNPGEIIETIQTRADGQNVRVLSGTYSIQNVTSLQDVTTSHTIVTGSSISYKPPPGTTRVIYEFYVYVRLKDPDVLIHFAGRLAGTQVSHTRSTFRSRDYEQQWVYNNMTITIGDVGSDNLANGKLASWTTNKTIDFTCRDYTSGYEAYLHGPEHWDGGGTSIKITPFIKITAIA
tara:strand:- start:68 stop:2098 length:2031 start_codon:yes stop_codon:yes gene_type:complete